VAQLTEIGEDILASSQAVTLSVASDEGGDTSHGFKFRAPVGRALYVLVADGVRGRRRLLSGKPFAATVKVEPHRPR
jgi:hypothetical protein